MTSHWRDIMSLPKHFKAHPLPTAKSSAVTLQLEQVAPFFVVYFSTFCQSLTVEFTSPAVLSLSTGNSIHIIREKRPWTFGGGKQTEIPFSKYVSPWSDAVNAAMSGNREEHQHNLLRSFAMMSLHGKCDQIVVCFGLFIIQTLKTHQFTYQGEKVIGWCVQDGDIVSNHPSIIQAKAVEIAHWDQLADVVDSIRKGEDPKQPGVITMEMTTNSSHVWITFVTESGRIFDMDLSSLQFGAESVTIEPVLRAEPTAFGGRCTRDRIVSRSMKDFEKELDGLINSRIASLKAVGQLPTTLTSLSMKEKFEDINKFFTMNLPGHLYKFSHPAAFWFMLQHFSDMGRTTVI